MVGHGGSSAPARTSPILHLPSPPTMHQLSRLALQELMSMMIIVNSSHLLIPHFCSIPTWVTCVFSLTRYLVHVYWPCLFVDPTVVCSLLQGVAPTFFCSHWPLFLCGGHFYGWFCSTSNVDFLSCWVFQKKFFFLYKPLRNIKWLSAITKLTAHFMCYLMIYDLVICRHRKSMVIHDTECPYQDQELINNKKNEQIWMVRFT